MQRTRSWSQATDSGDDDEQDLFISPKDIATSTKQNSDLEAQLQRLWEERENLNTQNFNLRQESSSKSARISILEDERNWLRMQVGELQVILERLQKDFEQVKRENRVITDNMAMQEQALTDIGFSKQELERQMETLRKRAAEETLEVKNKVMLDTLKETDCLKHRLENMGQQLRASKEDAKELNGMRIENKQMQTQITELVQQNIGLVRQLSEVKQWADNKEQHNLELRNEIENMKDELRYTSRELSPSRQPLSQTCNSDLELQPANSKPSERLRSMTLAEEIEHLSVTASTKALEEDTPEDHREEETSQDALEEFIHLTAAAVKICFPDVLVTSQDLIKKARKVPFYQVHDVLSKFMIKRLQREQAIRQDQLKRIIMKEEQPTANPIQQPSMLAKVRVFLRGSTRREQTSRNRGNRRFGFERPVSQRLEHERPAHHKGIVA